MDGNSQIHDIATLLANAPVQGVFRRITISDFDLGEDTLDLTGFRIYGTANARRDTNGAYKLYVTDDAGTVGVISLPGLFVEDLQAARVYSFAELRTALTIGETPEPLEPLDEPFEFFDFDHVNSTYTGRIDRDEVVVFDGERDDYLVTDNGNFVSFSNGRNVDFLSNIEYVRFEDSQNQADNIRIEDLFDDLFARDDTGFRLNENGAITISRNRLLGNDRNVDDAEFALVSSDGSAPRLISGLTLYRAENGDVFLQDDGNIGFIPDRNFFGEASFSYTLTDDKRTSTATVSLTVNEVNHFAPNPTTDSFFLNTSRSHELTVNDLLANDGAFDAATNTFRDAEGDILTITDVRPASNGQVDFDIDSGRITFTLDAGASVGTLAYDVSDGRGLTATGVAIFNRNVAENLAPVFISDDEFTVDENQDFAFMAQASDDDGDDISYSLSGDDAEDFSIDENGRVTFVRNPNYERPADEGRDNTYNIIVEASDDQITTEQDVTVRVQDANDNPVAGPNSFFPTAGRVVNISLNSILRNDSDEDGDTVRVTSVEDPESADVRLGSSVLRITPDADARGQETISYTVSDGRGGTATGEITLFYQNPLPLQTAQSMTGEHFDIPSLLMSAQPIGSFRHITVQEFDLGIDTFDLGAFRIYGTANARRDSNGEFQFYVTDDAGTLGVIHAPGLYIEDFWDAGVYNFQDLRTALEEAIVPDPLPPQEEVFEFFDLAHVNSSYTGRTDRDEVVVFDFAQEDYHFYNNEGRFVSVSERAGTAAIADGHNFDFLTNIEYVRFDGSEDQADNIAIEDLFA